MNTGSRGATAIIGTVLALEAGALVAFSVIARPFDLSIFLWGGHAVWHGTRLYTTVVQGNWFTYPPFSAALFTPLAHLPGAVARPLWELGTVAALGWACASTLRLAGVRPARSTVAAMVAGGLALEPVYQTLHLGQVNVYLLALVLADIERAARGRRAGAGIGLAAAVKLTPLIFIPFLLFTRRARDARRAADTFGLCGLIGYAVNPAASQLYWTRLFDDTRRFSVTYISNQSAYAALARVLGGAGHVGAWYLPLLAAAAAAGLALAVILARRGDWLGGTAAAGVTGLVVSPVSWAHHWVWVIPALAVLWRGGIRSRIAAAGGFALFSLAPLWFTPYDGTTGQLGFHGLVTVVANCFLLGGLAFLAGLAVRAWRERPGRPALVPAERHPQLLPERILAEYSLDYERSPDPARTAGTRPESRI